MTKREEMGTSIKFYHNEATRSNLSHKTLDPNRRKYRQYFVLVTLLVVNIISLEGALINQVDGQYLSCETSRLTTCQQDIIKSLQLNDLNSASVQYPINGPPYSPNRLISGHVECANVRSNLNCLLQTTPTCFELNIPASRNTDYIIRAKRFLEENGCNGAEGNWRNGICYRDIEARRCEEKFETLLVSPSFITQNNYNVTCPFYYRFKNCIEQHARLNCKVHEIDMLNEYLIDKTGEHPWRCLPERLFNVTQRYSIGSNYQLNNSPGTYLSPSRYSADFSAYDQRPIYGSAGNLNIYQPTYEKQWERFRDPSFEAHRYGIGRYPGVGVGDVFDRLVVASNGIATDGSDCAARAGPYVRECDDHLLDQQRLVRDSRNGPEMERKNCCALYQYRDCLARVVLDRCADSSTLALDLLMGVRRRELTVACGSIPSRDICSGSIETAKAYGPTLLLIVIISSYMTMKYSY